ncbi:hypothetical protein VU04_07255 [Desulfobulbus sp. TB]|nr:hypothetical protein [Desulfobulbus sp. TB]
MGIEEQQIAEFNALRAEILLHYSRRATRLTVCWTGLSLVFAGAAAAKIPELTFLSVIIAASAWIDDSNGLVNIFRVGAYIKIFLESKLSGLKWESALDEALKCSTHYEGLSGFLHRVSSTYFLTLIASTIGVIIFHAAMQSRLPLYGTLLIAVFSGAISIWAMIRGFSLSKSKTDSIDNFKTASTNLENQNG